MSKNVRTQLNKVVGKSLNAYHQRVKPTVDDLKFKEEYQGRIIDCMVGEVDDNYIETPETDTPIVKLEHSREGVVKIPSIKGKTILVDADGNETDTPGEGCKLVSVGEDENNKLIILSKNKNLFNKDDVSINTYQYCNGTNGNVASNNLYNTSGLIKVQHGKTYYFTGIASGLFYDINKKPIINKPIFNSVITPTEGIGYINLNISKTTDLNTVIVEEGSRSTTYVEPKQHKTEILLNKPLRKISDTIYDEIKEKEITYKVGSVVFNGEEFWGLTTGYGLESADGYISFYSDKLFSKININKGYKCNLFEYKRYDGGFRQTTDFEGISDGGGYKMTFVRIKEEKLKTKDVEGFKDYLKNNPIEVLYELIEPIIEELPNGITLQGFDDTTMYIENSITPTVSYGYNTLIPYKEELSQQKEEVEINTLDIENNIIPYLMDMEFNLMLMEDNE